MNRRGFLAAGLVPLAAACSSGGGSSGSTSAVVGSTGTSIPPAPVLERRVAVAGVAQSWDPVDIDAFAQRSGVQVATRTVASDAALLHALSAGAPNYDVVLPDAEHALIETNLGLLHPLDHSRLPNLANVDSRWGGILSDPHARYVVVKDAGVTGIVRRTDRLTRPITSWTSFFAQIPHHSELKVGFSNDPTLVVGLALVALGHSINSDDSGDLEAASDLLEKVRPYVTSIAASPVAEFSAGHLDLAMADTSDAREIQSNRAGYLDTVTALPRHGRMWVRTWAIAAGATHPVAAHALINDFLAPRVGAREMAYAGGEPGTTGSLDLVRPPELAHDPLVVPPDDVLKGSDVLRPTPLGLQQRLDIWQSFISL